MTWVVLWINSLNEILSDRVWCVWDMSKLEYPWISTQQDKKCVLS